MKQNTRILCGAMAAAMTVSLAGCASNAASSTTAESSAASSSVAAASANALTLTTESDGEVTVPLVAATAYTCGSMGDQGRAVTIKDNNGNVLVQGTSEYTVTVEDYSTTVDAANASVCVTFSECEVEKA